MRRRVAVLAGAAVTLGLVGAIARGGDAAAGDPRLVGVGNFISPVYVASPPGDMQRLFVVEQPGRIRLVRNGATLPAPFLDIRSLVASGGERGLLSMAFPPDYATSGLFYVYYTAQSPSGALTIAEYRAAPDGSTAEPSSRRTLLSIPHPRGNHNGGQLQFGPDGFLYIGTGDGGGANDPDDAGQRLNTLLGKLLRIDPRAAGGAPYSVPPSNPFAGQPGRLGEIWSYGLRNPWRFSFDRQTGDLTIGDVGQNEWEEIDFVTASSGSGRGTNFGWDCFEGREPYDDEPPTCSPRPGNHTPPVHQYSHGRGCSVTGGYVVRDPTLPALGGRYVYGDYCRSQLWSVRLQAPDAQDDRQLGLNVAGLTSFGEDACGRVYALSAEGPVYRIEPEGRPANAICPLTRPPVRCRVPRVAGLQLRTARIRIRRANCRVGGLRYVRSARKRGRVLKQKPRAGRRLARGTRVHLTLSKGRA